MGSPASPMIFTRTCLVVGFCNFPCAVCAAGPAHSSNSEIALSAVDFQSSPLIIRNSASSPGSLRSASNSAHTVARFRWKGVLRARLKFYRHVSAVKCTSC
jgi:hypothetical protein